MVQYKKLIKYFMPGFLRGILGGRSGEPGREGHAAFQEFMEAHRETLQGLLDLTNMDELRTLENVFGKMMQGVTEFDGEEAKVYAQIADLGPQTTPPSAAPEAAAPLPSEDEDASGTGTGMGIAA
jgi:hypothetical protein